ncbi:hypothetical protein FOCC_FOCC013255 [Frankliniella occidentalis]|nr:hypothetical protein FOCC_FOCC013255 [Frankliniella occidentalis]
MHLISVMREDRSDKSYVVAQTLSELISAASTELNLDATENLMVFEERTGVKIGADAVLQLLAQNAQKSQQTLQVLLSSSRSGWKRVPESESAPNTNLDSGLSSSISQSIPSTPSGRSTVIIEPISTDKCSVLPMRPIVEILNPVIEVLENPGSISSKSFLKMKKAAIKDLYQHVGKFMLRSGQELSLPAARHYAKTVLTYKDNKYAKIFEIKVGETTVNSGLGALSLQIYNHVNYSKGDDRRKKRGRRRVISNETEETEDVDGDLLPQKDKNALDYGCVCYAPPLPEDETEDSQENSRKVLLTVDPHAEEAGSLMRLTFASQRAELKRAYPLTSKLIPILERWPLLCVRDYLFLHADRLFGKQVVDLWHNNLGSKGKRFCEFMMVYWSTQNDKKPSQLARQMMDVLDTRSAAFESIGQMANSVALFPLLVGYLKEDEKQLLLLMPVSIKKKIVNVDGGNTTDEEMLAAAKSQTACPVLVVRGSSIFEEEANFDVVLLGKKSIKAINFIEGMLTTFVSYYVFGYQYPSQICRSLEFIQRFLLEINPEKGSRREKPSRLIDGLDSKVKELSEKLAFFGSDWGLTVLS